MVPKPVIGDEIVFTVKVQFRLLTLVKDTTIITQFSAKEARKVSIPLLCAIQSFAFFDKCMYIFRDSVANIVDFFQNNVKIALNMPKVQTFIHEPKPFRE